MIRNHITYRDAKRTLNFAKSMLLILSRHEKTTRASSPLLCPCAFFVLRSRLDPRPWAQLNLDAARIELATFSFTIDCYNHEAIWATGLDGCDKSSIRKSRFLMNDNTSPKICFAGGCGFGRLHWFQSYQNSFFFRILNSM